MVWEALLYVNPVLGVCSSSPVLLPDSTARSSHACDPIRSISPAVRSATVSLREGLRQGPRAAATQLLPQRLS